MKLGTQEQIRKIELNAYLISIIISIILKSNTNYETIQNIQNFLTNNNIDINNIREILGNIYTLNYLTEFRTETLTDEHKQLKSIYNEIVYNTAEFYNEIELSEPVSIFATYVYMYRKGFFSHNKQFLYSSNMKDFAKLQGIDTIRGRGVCRSISSLLTDIYNEMNMNSYNMMVFAKTENLKKIKRLCPISLESEKNETIGFKIIEIIAKYSMLANHLITMVEYENQNYIFDPTNDGFLQHKNLFQISISNDPDSHIGNRIWGFSSTLQNVLGVYSDGINIKGKYQQLNKPTIVYEEYEKRYLQALEMCMKNEKLFEEFYTKNESLINSIYSTSEQQSNLIKRLVPIIKK